MDSQKIGRYEIRSELGRGGMATVYHAYDPNFERDVAIKVLPEVFLHDPQFRARFEREAKTIASLEHPAIVPVYDFGESENQPFIVMRYMSGGTLSDRIKQAAFSLEESAKLISRLAPALDAAHAKGIIHRDIKPGNILFDQYGNAFLSDFGIAHLGAEGVATMTGGAALGTPAYMSPEQIQGDKKIDGRSDIYAMGVLVYQLITGNMPYSADTPAKVMMMHVLQPVPQILISRPDLPVGCDMIISRAMAKDPDDRFATVGELAEALESIVHYNQSSPAIAAAGYIPGQVDAQTPLFQATVAGPPTIKSASIAETVAAPSSIPATESKTKGSKGMIIGAIVTVLLVIIAIGLVLLGKGGQGPLAMLAPATATISPTSTIPAQPEITPLPSATPQIAVIVPTDTSPPPIETPTLSPTETITPTQSTRGPVIGGADKIAYVDGQNIWIANLDGSERTQLTTDGAEKINLQWSLDGNSIYYIAGKCIQAVNIESTAVDNLNCFNFSDSFRSFQISPDAKQVAMSLDNQLYLIPFDVEKIRQVTKRSDLVDLAECKDFAPYKAAIVQGAQWSKDQRFLSLILLANLGGGKQGNVIHVIAIDQCVPDPDKVVTFPGPTFDMEGYTNKPIIQNFGFNGLSLYTLNTFVRNEGFGDLYAFNAELNKSYPKLNPVDNRCCYRDSQFSPDGSYLVFVYQDFMQGANSTSLLYLVPYGKLGTSEQFTPLPLPAITDPKEKPQPILRPTK